MAKLLPFHEQAIERFKQPGMSTKTALWFLGFVISCKIPAKHDELIEAVLKFFSGKTSVLHSGRFIAMILKIRDQKAAEEKKAAKKKADEKN